jgi:hypothetical protein
VVDDFSNKKLALDCPEFESPIVGFATSWRFEESYLNSVGAFHAPTIIVSIIIPLETTMGCKPFDSGPLYMQFALLF